ncbi:hypothetical protein HDU99_007471, partial [Rhizoclosmatium hyalinum]
DLFALDANSLRQHNHGDGNITPTMDKKGKAAQATLPTLTPVSSIQRQRNIKQCTTLSEHAASDSDTDSDLEHWAQANGVDLAYVSTIPTLPLFPDQAAANTALPECNEVTQICGNAQTDVSVSQTSDNSAVHGTITQALVAPAVPATTSLPVVKIPVTLKPSNCRIKVPVSPVPSIGLRLADVAKSVSAMGPEKLGGVVSYVALLDDGCEDDDQTLEVLVGPDQSSDIVVYIGTAHVLSSLLAADIIAGSSKAMVIESPKNLSPPVTVSRPKKASVGEVVLQ